MNNVDLIGFIVKFKLDKLSNQSCLIVSLSVTDFLGSFS